MVNLNQKESQDEGLSESYLKKTEVRLKTRLKT